MTISCQEHEFKGHRAIICSQSPFFDAASDSYDKEADSSRVDLPCEDADTIPCVLSFCYTQDYGKGDDSVDSESDEIARNHLQVYLAADKFGIYPLRELASNRIIDWAKSNWNSEKFPDVVQDIWRTTPPHEPVLRNAIVVVVSANIRHFSTKDNGNNVLIGNPKFAVAVLKRVAAKYGEVEELNNKRAQERAMRLVIGY